MKKEIIRDREYLVINDNDKHFCDKYFLMSLHLAGSYKVYADDLGIAEDELIDYFYSKKEKLEGYFLSEDEQNDMSEDELENYIFGGNYGSYLSFQYNELYLEEHFIK
jgi:hypothetical protein